MTPITPTTELEAINRMLAVIGESPVNSSQVSGNLDANDAQTLIRSVSRELQSKGWAWNREEDYKLVPDSNGYIPLPTNLLKLEIVEHNTGGAEPVVRGSRLYDPVNHTYVFTQSVRARLTVGLNFDELPEPVRQYVYTLAGHLFQSEKVGSPTIGQFTADRVKQAKVALLTDETEAAQYNVLYDNSTGLSIVSR